MKKEKKEIRDLLLGKAVLDVDGKLITPDAGMFRLPQGVVDGAGAVRLFGIKKRERYYASSIDEEQTVAEASRCMQHIGRGLRLREHPDAAACLIRYVLTRPAILTFRYVDGVPLLTAWTGRGPTGWISIRRAVRAFDRELPDNIHAEVPVASPQPKRSGKHQKKKKNSSQKQAPSEYPNENDSAGSKEVPVSPTQEDNDS